MNLSASHRRICFAALFMTAGLCQSLPVSASPQQCAALWGERNRPFAEAGLCVETTLWKALFPNIYCRYTSGADISLPTDVAARLTEIRDREMQLGCRLDSGFGDAEISARSIWLDIGDRGSVFSAKDGYANLRDAPSAKSGNLIGRLDDGSRVKILERVQSPDNNALWFRVTPLRY